MSYYQQYINEHGVKGEVANREFIPLCCFDCYSFSRGEPGEYGTYISPPYCEKNVFFPTRKGTCKKKTHYKRRDDAQPQEAA